MGHIPKSGDVYVVSRSFSTTAGKSYYKGDKITLLEPTDLNPHNTISNLCNWLVRCQHFEPPLDQAVWSNIWMMIEDGSITWGGDICEHTFDGVSVCTKCGGFRDGLLFSSEEGRRVCREYVAESKLPICTTCGFNVMLHGWNK